MFVHGLAMKFQFPLLSLLTLAMSTAFAASDELATFYRGVNLAGPAIQMDGQAWLAGDDASIRIAGDAFENQAVPLIPRTDASRARMLRSSRWGGSLDVELLSTPDGWYQVFVYAWEDNRSEDFQLLINDQQVIERVSSGPAGSWHRLGPFPVEVKAGVIKVSTRGGAANLSGIEVWKGRGTLPPITPNGFATEPTSEQLAFFENKIRPLLVDHCYDCHSADAGELGGGLLLDSRKGIVVGGETEPPVIPNDPNQSLLIRAVTHRDTTLRMPPDEKLSDDEIESLRAWVTMGAPDPRDENTVQTYKDRTAIDWEAGRDFWSLRSITTPSLPVVQDADWPTSDLDYFILSRIEASGLAPSQDADKRTLIRRATFDLIGLPPTPPEIDAFVNDRSPDAFERLVDRLLSSRHYGERWGRYWLDVVRYSDTAGDNSDFPIPQMMRYRDWVIDAFNRDLPYDEFVRHQLAGDLLPYESSDDKFEKTIATGYIAGARRFGSRVDDYPQHLTIEDTIDNFGRTFLGASLNCARCHDHKFDPFSTEDYYAIYGIFHSTRYPWPGIELEQKQRDLVPLADEQTVRAAQAAKAEEQERLQDLAKQLETQRNEAPEGSDERKKIDKQWGQAKSNAEKHSKSPLAIEQAYAVCDAKTVEDSAVQIKGNPAKLGERVPRRFLSVLGGQPLRQNDSTSGRLQLAEWIVDPNNPLAMRVIVNRVWLNHFGKGLVPTPNDFGRQGKAPTHPALLDWLASTFRESGYSIKALHRTIMRSRTYQLSSQANDVVADQDPTNELLTAFPRRRLDAEAIRDTLLTLGGLIDLSPSGAHPFPPQSEWKFTQHNPFKAIYETNHRSVYLMTQRIQRHPFLAIFDGPDPSVSTPQRLTSTTPLQSLFFLNDPLVHDQANRFARRIIESSDDDDQRLSFAFLHALGREPNADEIKGTHTFLEQSRSDAAHELKADESDEAAWQAMVRVILRLNEFVYVD
jgi:hypothetical protein